MRLAAALLLGAAIFASSVPPRVTRSALLQTEGNIDGRLPALQASEPGYLLGPTRGVYLEGYGAVFTSEVDLLPAAAPNPFRPQYSKQEIQALKAKKSMRLELLKVKMREALIGAALPLDSVPLEERIALAVTVPYFSWEDSANMPRQILMSAPRRVLLQGSKGNTRSVEEAVLVQEF